MVTRPQALERKQVCGQMWKQPVGVVGNQDQSQSGWKPFTEGAEWGRKTLDDNDEEDGSGR